MRELLNAKLVDMRRETSHTDSPRFRETLYEVEATLQRVLDQLPKDVTSRFGGLKASGYLSPSGDLRSPATAVHLCFASSSYKSRPGVQW